jgi:aspartyl-tRNA(Asn)/glutamyl-tRNA(Gln) amidotransferase subunit A
MTALIPDPLEPGGIESFAARFRGGAITAEAATSAYLERIEALDGNLGAFEFVAAEQALATARAMDSLLAAGVDLGPLMGVPGAIKDLFAVEGTPATAGSNLDVADIIGPEGSFVKTLKRAGCVILGKTKTVEFAFGGTGINDSRGTPWNPWDADTHRIPGGSSSGSAVAVAAGMCAFAIGSDTGGSVRVPSALCGTFGLKTTVGLWPLDGVFPLCPTLDTIGPLTKSAADAAIVYGAVMGGAAPQPVSLRGVRLGKPETLFYEDLDPAVEVCMASALAALEQAGAEIVPMDVPEAAERGFVFPALLAVEFIAALGRQRYLDSRGTIDPVVWGRAACGLDITGTEITHILWRLKELSRIAVERMQGLDGWITPTVAVPAPTVAQFTDFEASQRLAGQVLRNTHPGNMFGLCATTLPIQAFGSALPVGLQILCPPRQEAHALALSRAIEGLVGRQPLPDLAPFL